MAEFLERVIPEALSAALSQALILIYCRHLAQPDFRRDLRALVIRDAETLRQFDALDELHAEYPFTQLSQFNLQEELGLLYWHNRQIGEADMMRQLRMLCTERPTVLELFDKFDGAEIN